MRGFLLRACAVAALLCAASPVPSFAQSEGTLNLQGPSGGMSLISPLRLNQALNQALAQKADAGSGVMTNPTLMGTVNFGNTTQINYGNNISVPCTGNAATDTAALTGAIAAAAASPFLATKINVLGACVSNVALSVNVSGGTSHVVAIQGDGAGVTTITFANATDGIDALLGTNGCVKVQGLSLIRGPTSPVRGNVGLSLVASSTPTGNGCTSVRDVTIQGSSPYTTEWNDGLVASTLSIPEFQNVHILGINGDGSDHGDAGAIFEGTGQSTFGIGYVLDGNSLIQGYSTGLLVTGPVQGVTVAPGVQIIGDNYGIKAVGSGTPVNYTTTGTIAPGQTTLQFAPGTFGGVVPIAVLNVAGVPPNANITNINTATGVVTFFPAATGTEAAGQTATIAPYYSMEEIAASGASFNANASCFYAQAVTNVSVIGPASTCIRFTTAGGTFAGVDFENSSAGFIGAGMVFNGQNTGTEHAIVINSQGYVGQVGPMTVNDVTGSSFASGFVELTGTTQAAAVDHVNCNGCNGGLIDNTANPTSNALGLSNILNGLLYGAYLDPATGIMHVPGGRIMSGGDTTAIGDIGMDAASGYPRGVSLYTAGVLRWHYGINAGSTETGGDSGADWCLVPSHDDGSATGYNGLCVGRHSLEVQIMGHLRAGAPSAPALSGCAGCSINSNATDVHGIITAPAGTTGFTVTFAGAYSPTPDCTVSPNNGVTPSTVHSATTELDITWNAATTPISFTYHCIQ
jgi:hypothetical protein